MNEVSTESKQVPYQVVAGDNNTVRVKIGDRVYTPQEISAIVLQKMKKTAEDYLGSEVTEAVITVLLTLTTRNARLQKKPVKLQALKVLRIINEPTAAALAYGLDKKHKDEKIACST